VGIPGCDNGGVLQLSVNASLHTIKAERIAGIIKKSGRKKNPGRENFLKKSTRKNYPEK